MANKKLKPRPKVKVANKADFKTVNADYDNNITRLCFDLANTTGWAVIDENSQIVDSGKYTTFHKSISTMAKVGTANMFQGFMDIHRKELFEYYGDSVDEVCIEFADFQKGQNQRYFVLNYATIALLCQEYKLPMTMVYVQDIKSFLGVSAWQDKKLVVNAINSIAKAGLKHTDHDIADAIAIGLCAHYQGKNKTLHYAP